MVAADWLFTTTTTAVLQPLTGWWLMRAAQLPMSTPWIAWSWRLYALAIACWLPVVWIELRLRDEANVAAQSGQPRSPRYWRFFIAWVVLGAIAFVAFLLIFWLMVSKRPPWQG